MNNDMNELQRAVGRIESKLNEALAKTSDHEPRIRALEKNWWRASGAGAVVGVVASSLVTFWKGH